MPREFVALIAAPLTALRLVVRYDFQHLGQMFTPRSAITHRVDVRREAPQKQAALAAHRSQLGRGRAGRVFRVLVALPAPVYGLICGREWFVEPGVAPGGRRGDILAKAA